MSEANRRPSSRRKGSSGKSHKKKVQRKPLILRFLSGTGTVILTTFLSFFLLFAVTGTICAIAAAIYITNYMDDTQKVSIGELATSYQTNVYEWDKSLDDWVVTYSVQAELQRIPITLDKVPQYTRDAFVCAEDERFYSHEGVDFKRTAASFANMVLHFWNSEQGGSTITQQLVKNITQDNDKSPQRKIREIKRAMRLEKDYSKDEILEAYLNYIGFGGAANGIEMAARKYFGKHTEELTIAESACLAAIPQSPEQN
ncbi:MAG: transglycosylase domain-containing protein, partial [Oscillospiraceae bacterium]|nr:transglycosylase domain-containing protein [Oscillospiraceae bacterium]